MSYSGNDNDTDNVDRHKFISMVGEQLAYCFFAAGDLVILWLADVDDRHSPTYKAINAQCLC